MKAFLIESPILKTITDPIKIEVDHTERGHKADRISTILLLMILSKRTRNMNVRKNHIIKTGKIKPNVFIILIKEANNHIVVVVTKMKETCDLNVVINTKKTNDHSVNTTKILVSPVEEEAVILVTKSLNTVMISTCHETTEEEISQGLGMTMTVIIMNLADKIEAGTKDNNSLLVQIFTTNSLLKTKPELKTVPSILKQEAREIEDKRGKE
jgi:hypothetical protein